jgi:ribosome recycling factor
MEELRLYLDEAKELMEKTVAHTNNEFLRIRAGKALPTMLDGIMVMYYGNPTPINQVASINTPDARSLVIKPWERKSLGDIERAIINSDLGMTPQNDGELIRLNIPPLTEERRKSLVKQAKQESENGKISIRNIRKDTLHNIKALLKEGLSEDEEKKAEVEVQALTDKYIAKIEELLVKKEEDIMRV